jgi:hypothetical protein
VSQGPPRRLVPDAIGDDQDIGRWLAAFDDGCLRHEAEHRSHIAWLRDTPAG